jgi:electron transfer flavoprotein beta subunit
MTILVCVTAGVPAATLAARGTAPRSGTGRFTLPTDQLGRHDAAAVASAVGLAADREDVVAVSVGGQAADAGLRIALAQGCGRAIRVDRSDDLDGPTVAELLAGVVGTLPGPVTVVTGVRGSAWETGQVPGLLACRLGVVYLAGVTGVDATGDGLAGHWRSAAGDAEATAPRAAVVSVARTAGNRPTVPSLHATVGAFEPDIDVVAPAATSEVPVATLIGSRVPDPARQPVRFGVGELDQAASAVATRLLHHYVGR